MREPLRLITTTPPVRLPITFDEIKSYLRIDEDQTGEDALLLALASAAVEQAEEFLGRSLITQTLTLFRDNWPRANNLDNDLWEGTKTGAFLVSAANQLELPKPPLQSVVHIKTYDDSDAATTWNASNYFVDTASEPGRVVVRNSQVFPEATRVANGIEIQFVAGYGNKFADIPWSIREGNLKFIAWSYEHRGEEDMSKIGAASGAHQVWRPHRILSL